MSTVNIAVIVGAIVGTVAAITGTIAIWPQLKEAGHWLKQGVGWLSDPMELQSESDTPSKDLQEYLERVAEKNRQLSFPGLARPLELGAVLRPTRVAAIPEADESSKAEIKAFSYHAAPSEPRDGGVEGFESGEILPWQEISDISPSWFIIGPTGSGKSTLLQSETRRLSLQLLQHKPLVSKLMTTRLPVKLTAREVSAGLSAGRSFEAIMASEIISLLQLPTGTAAVKPSETLYQWVKSACAQNLIILMVNGLDEVYDQAKRGEILNALEKSWIGRPLLVSSRPSPPGAVALTGVRSIYVRSFSATRDVPKFVRGWVRGMPDEDQRAQQILEMLQDPRAAELAQTPLLLAFICLNAEHGNLNPPSSRADLYKHILNGLLETWPNKKALQRRFTLVKLPLLKYLGWMQMHQPEGMTGNTLLQDLLARFGKQYDLGFDEAQAFLTEVSEIDGVLQARRVGIETHYSFTHPTIAEYFVASAAAEDDTLKQVILTDTGNERWYGVLPMLAGMTTDTRPLFQAILDTETAEASPRSELLTSCVAECRSSLSPDEFLSMAQTLQQAASLPWTRLYATDIVMMGLERIGSAAALGAETLLAEFRANLISPELWARRETPPVHLPNGVERAESALRDEHALVCWVGCWALGVLRSRNSFQAILPSLRDENPAVRCMAAWSLGLLKVGQTAPALREVASDAAWPVRKTAASSLGLLEDDQALPLLIRLSSPQEDIRVRRSALFALAHIVNAGKAQDTAVHGLADVFLNALAENDIGLVGTALRGVGLLAQRRRDLGAALPRAIELLRHQEAGIRASAAFALSCVGSPESSEAAVSALQDSDVRVRASAASALGRIRFAAAIPALCHALGDEEKVQRSALWALKQMPGPSTVHSVIKQTMQELAEGSRLNLLKPLMHWSDAVLQGEAVAAAVQLLGSAEPGIRASACGLFQQKPVDQAVTPCIRLLEDDDPRVRASACMFFQQKPVDEAVKPCLKLLEDDDPRVRASACGFFQQKPVDQAVTPCIRLLEDDDPRVRASACSFFQQKPVDEAVKPCLKLLEDDDPRVRASACGFFQQKPVDQAVTPCIRLLEDDDPRVRASACGFLRKKPVDEAVEPCLKLLEDDDSRVRASACRVLQQKPVNEAVQPCLKLLQDADPHVRASACGAVARLVRLLSSPQRSAAIQSLSQLRQDSNEFVRNSADFLSRALFKGSDPGKQEALTGPKEKANLISQTGLY